MLRIHVHADARTDQHARLRVDRCPMGPRHPVEQCKMTQCLVEDASHQAAGQVGLGQRGPCVLVVLGARGLKVRQHIAC